jgi:hypothetical protein
MQISMIISTLWWQVGAWSSRTRSGPAAYPKELVHVEVEHRPPLEILQGIEELEGMLR